MSRGRKAEANAQRRGGHSPERAAGAVVLDAGLAQMALAKPPSVASSPTMSACWDSLIGLAPGFRESDAPLLEAYCFWYAVFCQAVGNVTDGAGGIATTVENVDPDTGEPKGGPPRANPDLKTAERASTMMRQLADTLNITPTARVRTGLMKAMTVSTTADVLRRTKEGLEKFQKMQEKRGLPGD